MATFIYLTSGIISDVVERDASNTENIKHFHHVCKFPALLTTISSGLWVVFSSSEFSSLIDSSVCEYFSDMWNWVD